MNSKKKYNLRGVRNGHEDDPKHCPKCIASPRPPCIKCGHSLTGVFDEHGWTTCEVCGDKTWLGVGFAND